MNRAGISFEEMKEEMLKDKAFKAEIIIPVWISL